MEKYSIADWFHSYEKDVTTFLIYFTGSIEVEDLVQDTFLVAMNKSSNFKGESHPKTWLISIARNIVIDRYRRAKVWERIKHILSSDEAYSLDVETSIIRKLENNQLNSAIHKLSNPYKEVVILRGILDFSSQETSSVLKCSQNKVNVMYHRALKKLREILEEDGFLYDR
ncbi:RNA polymerase sigma factor [Paenisporosarcina quisquiliarum]|uniref:RNA polymerase sigma factor n=1 Tax=Paenisporosarcina quisquiliarum TaxID=365346 RepID=UPI0037368981